MSWLSKWLSERLGVPEVHVTTAESVSAAVAAEKVAITDELTGKADDLIPDLIAAVETSAGQVLANHTPTPQAGG